MKTFRWRGGVADDETPRATSTEDPTAADYSPARSAASYRSSTNSSVRGVGGSSSRAPKSPEGSPNASWRGSGTADEGVGAAVAGPNGGGIEGGIGTTTSNKKMLKIGANVRFRGDVMECNTVVLCGRLQVKFHDAANPLYFFSRGRSGDGSSSRFLALFPSYLETNRTPMPLCGGLIASSNRGSRN